MPSHNPPGLLTYKLVDKWLSFTCPDLYPDRQFDKISNKVEDWNSRGIPCWNYSQDSTVRNHFHGCGKDPVHHLKTQNSQGIPTWHLARSSGCAIALLRVIHSGTRNTVLVMGLYFRGGANPILAAQEHGGTSSITQDNRPTWVAVPGLINF